MPLRVPSPTNMRAVSLSQPLPAVLLSFACFAVKAKAFILAPHPVSSSLDSPCRRLLQRTLSPAWFPSRICGSALCAATHQFPRRPAAAHKRASGVKYLTSVATQEVEKVSGLGELLHSRNGVSERFVFFGGKGGVGKTSTAAAVAIQCADAGLR